MDGPRSDKSIKYTLAGLALRAAGSAGKFASLVGGIYNGLNGEIGNTAACCVGYTFSDFLTSYGDTIRNEGTNIATNEEIIEELKKSQHKRKP